MNDNNLRIAIDGGAATGKSTVSKLVAKELGIRYINTGQMYRLFALIALRNNIVEDENAIYEKIKDLEISYGLDGNIVCEEIDFTIDELVSQEVAPYSSIVSVMPKVRGVATFMQQQIGKENGVLMEGRDIGTIIMPDAPFKFFLTVNPRVAAHRRYLEHLANGDQDVNEEEIYKLVVERNERDSNRAIAPLKPATDSIIIDTSELSAIEVVKKIVEVIHG